MSNSNFYSMDKLVEFGLGISIATQMADAMNRSLDNMQIPGAGQVASVKLQPVYYAVIDGKQSGPYSITELSRLISDKKIVKETYIWKPGMRQWDLAKNVNEVINLVALTPPPVPDGCK